MIDFAIVGQPKSGTSALAEFLGSHPEICICVPKEPAYFATDLMRESDAFHGARRYFEFRTEADYAALFAHCRPGHLRGDASTAYLYSNAAAGNLHVANPDLKVVVMLRDPVPFMQSLHRQYLNDTTEDEPDFERALEKEPLRRRGESIPPRVRGPSYLFYRERARYSSQLERYYALFPRANILTLTMEEFGQDNEREYRRVLAFLGVDPSHVPAFHRVNVRQAPRSRALNHILNNPVFKGLLFRTLGPRRYTAVRKGVAGLLMKEQAPTQLSPLLEQELRDEFRPEVERVSKIVGRDLGAVWGY
jgi:hypothetical protein